MYRATRTRGRSSGELRGDVGATGRGEVAVLDVGDDDEIDDVDPTIPGTTALFVDDLISDVGAHPYDDFVFTVNSSTGSLSVIRDDRRVRHSFVADVADEPLLDAVVFPSAEATLLEGRRARGSRLRPAGASTRSTSMRSPRPTRTRATSSRGSSTLCSRRRRPRCVPAGWRSTRTGG